MRNCSMLFKIIFKTEIILSLFLLASCSPLKEKLPTKPLVELEYVDPNLAQQNSDAADHNVTGNLTLEVQQDLSTNKTNVYALATFHEPEAKNILFDKIRTGALSKNIYKPKPPAVEPPPCGIPGFPDCPNSGNPNPPTPDEPCGIPGFPDCPTNKMTNKTLTKNE